jgi:hypothetical protein
MQREKKGNEIIQILENQNAYLSIQINGIAYLIILEEFVNNL